MPSQVTPQNLGDQLRAAVEAIEGVTLQDRPSYYTVKYGTTTLGYVNGRRKFRVDLPIRGGKREQFFVTKSREIPRAVKLLTSFIPQEKAA